MKSEDYLTEIKSRLVTSPIISSIEAIVQEWTLTDQGYFRARLELNNGDFLEVAEYFVIENEQCVTRRYRYQWMDQRRVVLRKRWDNVEHFPGRPNFPHHVHTDDRSAVPGYPLSILDLIGVLEKELSAE
jgi:hypothetical protein